MKSLFNYKFQSAFFEWFYKGSQKQERILFIVTNCYGLNEVDRESELQFDMAGVNHRLFV